MKRYKIYVRKSLQKKAWTATVLSVENQFKINKKKKERYFILMKLLAHQKYKTFMSL